MPDVFGPNLIANGDFEQSVAGQLVDGPFWTSVYGKGTNAWSVDNVLSVVQVAASRVVRIGPAVIDRPILAWPVALENGAVYELSAIVVHANNVGAESLQWSLNGVDLGTPWTVFPLWTLPNPAAHRITFVYTGPTGIVPVSVRSKVNTLNGNDLQFDDVSVREVTAEAPAWRECCNDLPQCYRSVCTVVPVLAVNNDLVTNLQSGNFNNRGNYVIGGAGGAGGTPVVPSALDNAMQRLYDGNLSGFTGHIVIEVAGLPANSAIDLDIDCYWDTPRNYVDRFRIYHGYGGDHADQDGVGPGCNVHLLDANFNILTTAVMVSGNNGSGWVTPFPGGPWMGVKGVRIERPRKTPASGTQMGIREVQLMHTYRASLTWACGGNVVTGEVTGAGAGLAMAAGQIVNTGGPKDIFFNRTPVTDFVGTVITNTPAMFDKLTVADTDPMLRVLGDASFSMRWEFPTPVRTARVDITQTPPVWTDLATGAVIDPGAFQLVPCQQEGDVI